LSIAASYREQSLRHNLMRNVIEMAVPHHNARHKCDEASFAIVSYQGTASQPAERLVSTTVLRQGMASQAAEKLHSPSVFGGARLQARR
jgi:hypothetical protein